MSWIKDIFNPQMRQWEEFYRNRWQHDKIVRSTHGVNCTGGCSWNVYVKNGIVTWEMQAIDYPKLESSLPLYEPRGCQRGIVYSWYIYSPLRVKYPYLRGVLMDLWTEARDALTRQVTGAVRWVDCMKTVAQAGAELFVEVGPGTVLCGLLKQIDPALKSLNVEDAASLEKTLAELKSSSPAA